MLLAEHPLAAVKRPPQSPRRVAQRPQASARFSTLVSVFGCSLSSKRSLLSSARRQSGNAPAASPNSSRHKAKLFTLLSVFGCSLPSTRSLLSSALW